MCDKGGVEKKFGGAAFPDTPRACRLQTNRLVIARQPAVISAHHVCAFIFRNDFQIFFPDIRENLARAFLIEPANLFGPAKKDPTQHKLAKSIRTSPRLKKAQAGGP